MVTAVTVVLLILLLCRDLVRFLGAQMVVRRPFESYRTPSTARARHIEQRSRQHR
jgi:hypothetical protein